MAPDDGTPHRSNEERSRREEAWAMYQAHGAIFRSVLRDTGPWPFDDAEDALHDFLLDKLPRALRSFDATRGSERSWLYSVFLRYARHYRYRASRDVPRLDPLDLDADDVPVAGPDEALAARDQARFWQRVRALPEAQREILEAFFAPGAERMSLRAFASAKEMTRYQAREELIRALALLVAGLDGQGVLGEDERVVTRAILTGRSAEHIAQETGLSKEAVRRHHRGAMAKVRSAFLQVTARNEGGDR